jgi:hypothetical protein
VEHVKDGEHLVEKNKRRIPFSRSEPQGFRCHYPFPTQLSHAVFAGFHARHAKRIMASLDDLEVQRVKPFERLCFVMYVVLYMIFVFMALSFVKLLTTPS